MYYTDFFLSIPPPADIRPSEPVHPVVVEFTVVCVRIEKTCFASGIFAEATGGMFSASDAAPTMHVVATAATTIVPHIVLIFLLS